MMMMTDPLVVRQVLFTVQRDVRGASWKAVFIYNPFAINLWSGRYKQMS